MTQHVSRRLFRLTVLFTGFYALALTISPAVVARSWGAGLRWEHWLGFAVWLAGFWIVYLLTERYLPQSDPYLLPLTALLTGWGLMTIWQLTPIFGLRQSLWLAVTLTLFSLGLRAPSDLNFLRRYKYLWLTGGLILTALTLIFGTNPMGFGPRLWLGCCGIYFQPSEPLKLLLVIYLSAYFSERGFEKNTKKLKILAPTLVMTGIALLLLLVQRDLGTASIFIFLYSVMVYLAMGWRWIPALSALGIGLAGLAGYATFDVIRLRVEAWVNPWLDPSGRSYQIVQSLIAVANGGIFGRGPGLGNPEVVPVTHSDFIFAAIAEGTGLVGSIGLLVLLALLTHRGLSIALRAENTFHRYLAASLTAYIAAQSVLIIGGNLRLLPLTGVTLPFVSYGGSSLLISIMALLLLMQISADASEDRSPSPSNIPIFNLASFLFISLGAAALVTGWWAYQRGPALLTRTDNPRRALADLSVPRGALLDRYNTPLVETRGEPGYYQRVSLAPALGPLLGYNHAVYGQAGLEASLDSYLRGLQGSDPLTLWGHHLLYGQPPPGLDTRLTIDLNLQNAADQLLGEHTGALLLLNAENGEILALASHPTYDSNHLDESWESLVTDENSPLLNRVSQGRYPAENWGGFPLPELNAAPLRLPGSQAFDSQDKASPLHAALMAAAIVGQGHVPAPSIAQAVRVPDQGWVLLSPLGESSWVEISPESQQLMKLFHDSDTPTWHISFTPAEENLTWYVGGTRPHWTETPFALVIVLESNNLPIIEEIAENIWQLALGL
ncbi:MAG: FtsW/RodA/SpoVE family cell cycle protein [Chloroflexota bacterium]